MTTTAYGNTTWWGFSPAQNLLEVLSRYEIEFNEKKELNFLLIGSGDGRHILKTLPILKHSKQKVNFFVIENDLETVARQILLINLILESSIDYGLQEKSELFLDLYGNSLTRDATEDYLGAKCNEFIRWITDFEYVKSQAPIWDFSNLKFKELDQLEGIFKFWRNKERVFNVAECLDQRSRQYLGVRYDTRENSYDWEYSMKLIPKASIVNWHEYKRWRENGVAFQVRDESAYEVPNKTLASGMIFKKDGERITKRGYFGDIINSPYMTYGIESDNQSLFKRNNNIHTKTSTDVTMFNICSIIHELTYGTKYTEQERQITEIIEEEPEHLQENKEEVIRLENVQIYFLPTASVVDLQKKSKYKNKFDIISFSNSMVHFLDASVSQLFSKDGLLMIESTKFMLDLKDELHSEYGKKITGMAKNADCAEIKQFNADEHCFAVFKHEGH